MAVIQEQQGAVLTVDYIGKCFAQVGFTRQMVSLSRELGEEF
jgi:hypothetical protein